MGRAGSTVLERIPGGRQALKKEVHLEEREDGHFHAEGNPVIDSEIQFWPVREEEIGQIAGMQGELRSYPWHVPSQASQPPAPIPKGFSNRLQGGP